MTDFYISYFCDWFVNNNLSIHFGEDKTKTIIFAAKRELAKVSSLDIRYTIHIKQ